MFHHNDHGHNRSRREEAGYALIGALWLLLLAAAIVAALMLQTLNSSRMISADRQQWVQQYRLESALETAMADLIINGPNSAFASANHRTTYTLGGKLVEVRASSEGERVDLNDGDLAQIDSTFFDMGIDPEIRANIQAQIIAQRANSRRWSNMVQLRNLVPENISVGQRQQLMNMFTLVSGMQSPAPPENALRLDQPVRLEARMIENDAHHAHHPGLIQIIRPTISATGTIPVLDRWNEP